MNLSIRLNCRVQRILELYLRAPLRLHGVLLHELSTETSLPSTACFYCFQFSSLKILVRQYQYTGINGTGSVQFTVEQTSLFLSLQRPHRRGDAPYPLPSGIKLSPPDVTEVL